MAGRGRGSEGVRRAGRWTGTRLLATEDRVYSTSALQISAPGNPAGQTRPRWPVLNERPGRDGGWRGEAGQAYPRSEPLCAAQKANSNGRAWRPHQLLTRPARRGRAVARAEIGLAAAPLFRFRPNREASPNHIPPRLNSNHQQKRFLSTADQ